MPKLARPFLGALAAVACLLTTQAHAEARPETRSITPQDLVELEAFGRATISPDGRWAIYEKRGPYETATHFDYGVRAAVTIMDLWVVDLADPDGKAEPLVPGEGPGLQRLSWSPDSRRLLITRLRDDRLELGVVTVADRQVEWTGLTPDMPRTGATAEWISDQVFVVSTLPDSLLPEPIRYEQGSQARTATAWARSAAGAQASRTVTEAEDGLAWTETPEPPSALLRVDLATGERRVLTDRRTMDFAVSPDRRMVAVVQAGEIAPLATGRVTQIERAYRQRLSLIDLSNGELSDPIPGKDVASALLRWSPASDAVLVWARQDGDEWTSGDLTVVRPTRADVVDLGGLRPGTIDQVARGVWADWVYGSPVVYAQGPEGARYDWYRPVPGGRPINLTGELTMAPIRRAAASDRDLTIFADGALWALEKDGVRRLSPPDVEFQTAIPGDAEQVRRFMYNEAPRRDWAAATGPSGVSAVLSKGGVRTLGVGDGTTPRILAVSPEAFLVLERIGLEETLWLRTPEGERPVDAVNSAKRDVVLIEPVAVSHPGVDGALTTSWLLLPPDHAERPVRGVVVVVYPGEPDRLVWNDPLTMTYAVRPGVLAGAGFAVLMASIPDDPSPRTRGDTFARAAELAVDGALAAWPELPSDRLAIFGHSYGGYTAMEIATRSSRFRSYVASAGIYDWMQQWGQFVAPSRIQGEDALRFREAQGMAETNQGRFERPPWEAPDLYLGSSPWLRAGQITAPVLLLTGDLDFVPMTGAETLFSALYRERKRVRLITYWGEKHHVWSPANILDKYDQIFDWLDETLADGSSVTAASGVGAPSSAPRIHTPPQRE